MPSELAGILARRRAQESGAIWATAIPFSSLKISSSLVVNDNDDVKVFLGSGQDASNLSKLREHGIKRILNVADDIPNYHEDQNNNEFNEFVYCRLEVADFGGEALKLKGNDEDEEGGIQRLFGQAAEFVRGAPAAVGSDAQSSTVRQRSADTAQSKNGDDTSTTKQNTEGSSNNVLIHCANGSNRSVTVTVALLMVIDGCDLRTAWKTVKSRRRGAMPLKDNRLALLDFERKLRGDNSMDEDGFFCKSFNEP